MAEQRLTLIHMITNLRDVERCVEFCMSEGLISSTYECPSCREQMSLVKRKEVKDGVTWRCKKKHKDVKRCIRKGSFFEESKLGMFEVLMLSKMWSLELSNADIKTELGLSSHTVCDWKSFCREVCVYHVRQESEMLGGQGVTVEIDEVQFGKRKHHEGPRWVFGGVERGSRKCFMQVVQRRDKDTLLAVLRRYVRPGTTVYSDCWQAYDCLNDEGFRHYVVRHGQRRVDPTTGVHTNAIQGTWSAAKRAMRPSDKSSTLDSYLAEYIFRRIHQDKEDLFRTFLGVVRRLYTPNSAD